MKINFCNIKNHFKKIMIHRYWVRHYCFMAGQYWRGIVHDLSKYSPIEFFESVQYYQGTKSPILACKENKGYSMAWFHHRGRNRHHWEYWVDELDRGMVPKLIPEKYAIEMFCDFLAAGRTYMGIEFTPEKEVNWWKTKRKTYVLHPAIRDFIDSCFTGYIAFGERYVLNPERLHRIYITCREGNEK